ncbi:hypothetical protein GCM10022416_32490 [Actinomadura keratinilytica]|uniref:Uncharacterized protein n=1 Tax=Actinomadura keratinilytica TaxID=547461 RepID=A0ABP7YXD1_9ACTN
MEPEKSLMAGSGLDMAGVHGPVAFGRARPCPTGWRLRWSAGSKAGGRPLPLSGPASATGIMAAMLAAL